MFKCAHSIFVFERTLEWNRRWPRIDAFRMCIPIFIGWVFSLLRRMNETSVFRLAETPRIDINCVRGNRKCHCNVIRYETQRFFSSFSPTCCLNYSCNSIKCFQHSDRHTFSSKWHSNQYHIVPLNRHDWMVSLAFPWNLYATVFLSFQWIRREKNRGAKSTFRKQIMSFEKPNSTARYFPPNTQIVKKHSFKWGKNTRKCRKFQIFRELLLPSKPSQKQAP